MGFFSKKNKENKNQEADSVLKVERELIVHNMPSQQRISGEIVNSIPKTSAGISGSFSGVNITASKSSTNSSTDLKNENSFAPEKKSFKMVGVLIIFLALLLLA